MKIFEELKFVIFFITVIILIIGIRIYNRNYFSHSVEETFELSLDTNYYLSHLELEGEIDYTIIDIRDIRDADTYINKHMQYAVNIEFPDLLKRTNRRLLDRGDKVIIYSDDISESVKAKSLLNQIGYSNIYILELRSTLEIDKDSVCLKNEMFKYKFQLDTAIKPE